MGVTNDLARTVDYQDSLGVWDEGVIAGIFFDLDLSLVIGRNGAGLPVAKIVCRPLEATSRKFAVLSGPEQAASLY